MSKNTTWHGFDWQKFPLGLRFDSDYRVGLFFAFIHLNPSATISIFFIRLRRSADSVRLFFVLFFFPWLRRLSLVDLFSIFYVLIAFAFNIARGFHVIYLKESSKAGEMRDNPFCFIYRGSVRVFSSFDFLPGVSNFLYVPYFPRQAVPELHYIVMCEKFTAFVESSLLSTRSASSWHLFLFFCCVY